MEGKCTKKFNGYYDVYADEAGHAFLLNHCWSSREARPAGDRGRTGKTAGKN